MESNADRDDVVKAKDNDRAAFDRIVTRYYRMVYGLALSTTREVSASEDITQEAFLQAWTNLEKLRNADALAPWLRTITRNLALSWVRSQKVRDHVATRYGHLHSTFEHGADAQLTAQEQAASVTKALNTLPDYLRDAVVLYHIEGQSAADAARALGIGKNALKVRLYRARRRMRAHLEREIEQHLSAQVSETKINRARSQIAFALALGPVLPHSLALPPTAALSTLASSSTFTFSKLLGGIVMSAKSAKLTVLGIALVLLLALYLYMRESNDSLDDQIKTDADIDTSSREKIASTPQQELTPVLASPKAAINAPVATVGGRVTDQDSGSPIKDAEISIWLPGTRDLHRATTNANGEFRSEALTPGDYELECRPPSEGGYCYASYRDYRLRVVVAPDSALDGVDFVFFTGVSIDGRVTDEGGRSIVGASVEATSTSGPTSFVRRTGKTDTSGAFEIAGLHPGENASIKASAEGYATETLRNIPLPSTGTKENIELILHSGSSVAGVILDETSSPVANAPICLKGPGPYAEYCTVSDDSGRFRLDGVDAASYVVCVFYPDKPRQETAMWPRISNSDPVTPERVMVNPAENVENLTVQALEELEPQYPGLVTGVVLDSNNQPITRAFIDGGGTKEYSDYITNDDGRFTLRFRSVEGEIDINVYKPEVGNKLTRAVPIGTQDLQIKLQQFARVAGQVLIADTGEPCPAFTIQLTREEQPEVDWLLPYNQQHTVYSLNGDYQFRGLDAGNYVLTAWSPNRGRQTIALQLKEGQTQEIDLLLGAPQTLRGTVIDKNTRKPISEARIYLAALPTSIEHPELGHTGGVAQTDLQGAFQIENLSEGEVHVGVVHADYLPTLETISIGADSASDHAIALTRGGTVLGSVTREGFPVSNTRVQLMVEVDGERRLHRGAETDVGGNYAIRALDSGFYELVIWGPAESDGPFKQNIEIALGKDTVVNASY